jgi:choice-of-anchor A domain-containing protein
VFAAGNINVTNNQLQGGAAAGANVTMSSYGVSVGLPADGARLDLVAGGNSTFRTLARTAACATARP